MGRLAGAATPMARVRMVGLSKSREPQPRASAKLHTGAKSTINAGDRVLSIPKLDRLDRYQPETKMSRDNGKSESFSFPRNSVFWRFSSGGGRLA